MTTPRKRAAAPAAASSSPYKADALYEVQLLEPVPLSGGRFLNPMHRQRLRGRFLATLPASAVGQAVEVQPGPADLVE